MTSGCMYQSLQKIPTSSKSSKNFQMSLKKWVFQLESSARRLMSQILEHVPSTLFLFLSGMNKTHMVAWEQEQSYRFRVTALTLSETLSEMSSPPEFLELQVVFMTLENLQISIQ